MLAVPAMGQHKTAPATARRSPSPSVSGLDAKNGFRNYTFGVPIESVKGLQEVYAPGFDNGQLYEKPGESMGIGPVHLTSLYFLSVRGRLAGFMFSCVGETNNTNLLAVLKEKYGPGIERLNGSVVWRGKRIEMTYSVDAEKCTVSMISAPVVAAPEESYKSQIKKGVNDL
jgi:hypothetical protein